MYGTHTHALRRRPLALLLCALSLAAAACDGSQAPPPDDRPQITLEKIRDQIDGEMVGGIPDPKDPNKKTRWWFNPDEPKEITIVEQQSEGDRATIVIDMKTRSSPRANRKRVLSGRMRLHYELQSGLVLRQWEIVKIDNISFKDEFVPEEKQEEKQGEKQDGKPGKPEEKPAAPQRKEAANN